MRTRRVVAGIGGAMVVLAATGWAGSAGAGAGVEQQPTTTTAPATTTTTAEPGSAPAVAQAIAADGWYADDDAIDAALDETIDELRANPTDGLEALAAALSDQPQGFDDEEDDGSDPTGLIILGGVGVVGMIATSRYFSSESGDGVDGGGDGDGNSGWGGQSSWARRRSYRSARSASRARRSSSRSSRRSSSSSRRGRGGRRL